MAENPQRTAPKSAKKPKATTGLGSLNEDLLHTILNRLPAKSFAHAACVNKTWHATCNRILSKPKFSSASSINPSYSVALKEVLDKVLSEPIRPHFVIANCTESRVLVAKIHIALEEKLGFGTPIIVSCANGIMGRNAQTNEFQELNVEDAFDSGNNNQDRIFVKFGITVTVGFVPGLRVSLIPLFAAEMGCLVPKRIDDFVGDIKNFVYSTSGCPLPVGIIMFGNARVDQSPIIEKLDCALPKETIIVGDERSTFLKYSGKPPGTQRCFSEFPGQFLAAVALVFARDRFKPRGIGEIQIHAASAHGLSAVGPRFKTATVRVNESDGTTWLTARRDGEQEILDGEMILNAINNELDNRIDSPGLYIGAIRKRKCSIASEKSKLMTFLSFHGVIGGDEEYLFVDGGSIRTGDYFRFYHSDPGVALSSCTDVSAALRNLKLDPQHKREFIGGFIFSCCGRGEPFFGEKNVDSTPFLRNFPGVPLAGVFCGGEIGRGLPICNVDSVQEYNAAVSCSLHVYSSLYVVVSYTPEPPEL